MIASPGWRLLARRDLTDHGMPMDTYQLWATTGLVDMGHGKQHPKDTVEKQSIIHDGWTLLERATHPRDPQSHPPSIANGPRRDGWRWQPIATACNATGRGRAWLAGIAPVPSSASSWVDDTSTPLDASSTPPNAARQDGSTSPVPPGSFARRHQDSFVATLPCR